MKSIVFQTYSKVMINTHHAQCVKQCWIVVEKSKGTHPRSLGENDSAKSYQWISNEALPWGFVPEYIFTPVGSDRYFVLDNVYAFMSRDSHV